MNNQNCPICKCVFKGCNRYPNTICYDCITKYKTLTKDGKKYFFQMSVYLVDFRVKLKEKNNMVRKICVI